MNLEQSIVKHLFSSQSFFQRAASSIKAEFFEDAVLKKIFGEFNKLTQENFRPTESDVLVSLSKTLKSDDFLNISKSLKVLKNEAVTSNIDWLLKETENWLKLQAFKTAVAKNIDLMDNKKINDDERFAQGIHFMKEALRIGFTKVQALDFFDVIDNNKFDNVFDQYKFLKTGFKPFDNIFSGGFAKSALYVIMASTGVGKTLAMIFLAFEMMKQGHNVIYFSHEISKNALLVRVLSNMLSMKTVDIINLRQTDPEAFNMKLQDAVGCINRKGSLKIESFPNGQCSAQTLKSYLDELKVKYDWSPDAIFSDYLNIMVSARMSASTVSRHYYVQSIAEECRELASEFEVPFITATQTNRDGIKAKAQTDLTHMSESLGAAITADGVIALSDSGYEEEMVKGISEEISHVYNGELLKTRFGSNTGEKIVFGVSKDFQRFVDIKDLIHLPEEERKPYNEQKKQQEKSKKVNDNLINTTFTIDDDFNI